MGYITPEVANSLDLDHYKQLQAPSSNLVYEHSYRLPLVTP